MWRLAHLVFRAVSGATYWFTRRLTRAGMLVAGVLAVAGALGIDTNQTVAYKIFALAAGLLVVAAAGAWLLRDRCTVERVLPRLATAGESFTYRVTVTNRAGAPREGMVIREDLADPRPDYATLRAQLRFPTYRAWKRLIAARAVLDIGEQPVPPLAPSAAATVVMHGEALRRGSQNFTGLTLARADPLGLCNSLLTVSSGANLLVLPRRYALPEIALPGSRRYQPGGVTLASSVGESEEFMGLREYRAGDPLQRIHWRSFARAGEPIVKEYQDEFFERHALVLDTFTAGRDVTSFEEAVSVAASFACTVNTRECLLDLMFIGAQSYRYTAGRGQLSTGGLLEVLAGVQPCRDKPFSVLQDAILARRSTLTGCILILLGWDEAREELTGRLRSLGVPLLMLAVSANGVPDAPAWLHVLTPGRIQEGLAAL
jgi:uncharacterized protein (DUF58 family)